MSSSDDMQVPDGWENKKLGEISKIFSGGTPSRDRKDYYGGSIPWIKSGEVNQPVIRKAKEFITEEGLDNSSTKLVPKGTVLVAMYGATAGKVSRLEIDASINQAISAVCSVDNNVIDDFLYHVIQHNTEQLLLSVQGSGQPNLSGNLIKRLSLLLPPLPEQKKIASILSSVDDVIEKTEAQINKLQDLKKGMMTELLTKGIGHTEFKDSPVGKIPMEWEVVTYGDVVETYMPQITMTDEGDYSPVIVRRRHNGIEIREVKKGKNILVKQQYKAVPKTFLISKRQIFHGSCGIVPDNIGENAIISKEYLALRTKPIMDIRFLNYFSHTDYFQDSIIRTTYGVDKEKYVFKDQWWLKEFIPLPPLEEQLQLCDSIDATDKFLRGKIKRLTQIKSLKKALMNDLLTGKVRVNTASTTN